jgi:3'(2'), 5'-bisphosphate nucleotidase
LIVLKEYNIALKAAIAASKEIMRFYADGFETEIKQDGSPVTQADLAASKIIDSYLLPTNIPITGEETLKSDFEVRKHWTECWCVDPLDGTKEFVKKNGEFAVNIALIRNGKPLFGVIASPVNETILFGGKETGVFYALFSDIDFPSNWVQLKQPEQIQLPFILTCSRSHHSGPVLNLINELGNTFETIEYIKKGSSLKFFDLAFGRAAIYPRFAPTMEWDIAAGQAILEALGGCVLNAVTGEPLNYNKENLTNPYFIAKIAPLMDL